MRLINGGPEGPPLRLSQRQLDPRVRNSLARFRSTLYDDDYGRAIPEDPNYGYLLETQNAMRAALMPYLERFGLAIPDTRQGPPADYYNPVMRAGEASEYYTPPLNSPNFSVNYMTNAPRLFGGQKTPRR